MNVHIAIVNAFEVSAEREAFHPSKEVRVIGECILERTMFLAGLPHEDASCFFHYLGFDNSGVLSEIRNINLTFEDSLHCFAIAVGA
ncbi:MAG: hypothetical protein AUI12_13290 [Acidobacteria bacterium 13_2_20CM_2_57_6]|nr:MAG: hypothetical protein AUH16_10530 [Acidobacteria bacterium 13_2_20CM_57_7]OLB84534.1 MAG: hypothetical protein AUI12_13290 [Acidobacteria bacterium 13_2_20CM_2_57_6]